MFRMAMQIWTEVNFRRNEKKTKIGATAQTRQVIWRADNSVDADDLGVQMTLGSRAYRISTVMIYRTSEDSLVEIKNELFKSFCNFSS